MNYRLLLLLTVCVSGKNFSQLSIANLSHLQYPRHSNVYSAIGMMDGSTTMWTRRRPRCEWWINFYFSRNSSLFSEHIHWQRAECWNQYPILNVVKNISWFCVHSPQIYCAPLSKSLKNVEITAQFRWWKGAKLRCTLTENFLRKPLPPYPFIFAPNAFSCRGNSREMCQLQSGHYYLFTIYLQLQLGITY